MNNILETPKWLLRAKGGDESESNPVLDDSSIIENKESNEKYVGEAAIFEYYQKYTKFCRDSQNIPRTPATAYMQTCKKYRVLPSPTVLIKRTGSDKEISTRNLNLGKPYISALSSSMSQLNIKKLNLSNVRRNESGITDIICNLKPGIEQLDLSKSSIGLKSITNLWKWMDDWFRQNNHNLKYLNLSHNKLSDEAGVCLANGLSCIEIDLEELNISNNLLGDNTAKGLSKFIEYSYTMKLLNLGWNQITAKGGIPLFFGVYKGRTLRSINVSYNWLGRGSSHELIEMIVEAVNEETLRHLDLSYNNMNFLQCKKFGQLIEDNHTLYGLHMQGNDWFVDGIGFIKHEEYHKWVEYSKHTILSNPSVDGYSTMYKFNPNKLDKFIPAATCWVCEGWTENTFYFIGGKSAPYLEEPIYIHFEFNEFQAELMEYVDENTYEYTAMWPPGKITYFFTIDKIAAYAKDHEKFVLAEPRTISKIKVFDETKTFKITRFNTRLIQQGEVLNSYYMSNLKVWYPRRKLRRYFREIKEKERDPWFFKESVFAEYQPDTQQTMDEMFEHDWQLMQISIFEDDEEMNLVKAVLKKYYWQLREVYRYLAAVGTQIGGFPFAISLNQFYNFIK